MEYTVQLHYGKCSVFGISATSGQDILIIFHFLLDSHKSNFFYGIGVTGGGRV